MPHIKYECGIKRGCMSKKNKKEDLRVIKTKNAIRSAFREMICEMDYEDITIKALTARAMINRKTFYLHYESLDDLLQELQDEIVEQFTQQNVSYQNRDDIRKSIRFFFEYAASMSGLDEKLLCSGSYMQIGENINRKIMEYRKQKNKRAFSANEWEENLVFAYFSTNSIILYRQWIADGKKLSVEKLTQIATQLICKGLDSYIT